MPVSTFRYPETRVNTKQSRSKPQKRLSKQATILVYFVHVAQLHNCEASCEVNNLFVTLNVWLKKWRMKVWFYNKEISLCTCISDLKTLQYNIVKF